MAGPVPRLVSSLASLFRYRGYQRQSTLPAAEMALLHGPAQPDLWKTHEPTFRRLYVEQNLTLKAVKETVEAELGFPEVP